MEKFLIPAVPGPTPEKAPGPRATEEEEEGADSAQQGSPKEQERMSPLPGMPWKKIRAEGLICDYTTLYGRAQADEIFQQLEKEVEYLEGEFTKLHIFGKWHEIPRKQVTYGDAGLTYTYSGVTFSPKPWIPILNRIRDRVQLVTAHTFNFVLINRYKDGRDHMGEHRDDERELVPRSPIASVSFGACRDFIFRHGASRGKIASRRIAPVKLQLDHGSLLMMNFPTNHYWYHSLPSRKKVLAPRINLTFRKVRTL
ncbi:DNA oxidative demethylase ALKBH2 [Ahaetulla prasina]|uniref:DNA oxidative demethylase ALKBH2 n=1 Tax=Ahaetulla prasina TaxID=499056 RepID=UPI00264759DA|nr:DNA oxidative demethylase ALKBH2 [Ahaetulla prasina]